MGAAAGAASLASAGLGAYANLLKAEGTATADEYQAKRLEVAAQYGEVKADQTSAQMTRSLNTTLGNIAAVRAAANTDPTSPTGQAMINHAEEIGGEQRSIAVNSILQQARQDRSDAAYYRQASSDAMLAGEIGAGASFARDLVPLMKGG
jgi:hypothetical protein